MTARSGQSGGANARTSQKSTVTLLFWQVKPRDGNLFKAHGEDGLNRQFETEGQAPLAQSAERFHGKEKVNGSIPLGGSVDIWRAERRNKESAAAPPVSVGAV